MPVTTTTLDDLRIIFMDDGKLNCLATPFRSALLREFDAARTAPDCKAVVLIGNARAFSAGADLTELEGRVPFAEPMLYDTVIGAIETMPVPVVAAIAGTALGGGLELALGCNYRIAEPKALLGLPEVNVGLMPGAGGTQRLPRAIGLEPGLNMMLSGNVVAAATAPKGLVDRIAKGDLLDEAIAFAKEIADVRPIPQLSTTKMHHENYQGYLQFARGAVQMDPRRAPGLLPIIDAVEQTIFNAIQNSNPERI